MFDSESVQNLTPISVNCISLSLGVKVRRYLGQFNHCNLDTDIVESFVNIQ